MILICILKIHFVTCNFQESHESRKPPAVDNLLPATTEPNPRISQILSALNHVTTKMDIMHSNMITSHISNDNVVKCCENAKADQMNWA